MRLPRVLRALRPAPQSAEQVGYGGTRYTRVTLGDSPERALYGSEQQDSWTPPAPHADHRVSLGENVHNTLYRAPTRDERSLAEQIADMVNRSKT